LQAYVILKLYSYSNYEFYLFIYINHFFLIDGEAGTDNVTGDQQKKLDVLSNEMMVNSLVNSGVCAVLVSEENEEAIIVPESLAGKLFNLFLYL
jgi:fructose-1,6-bisphosphatase